MFIQQEAPSFSASVAVPHIHIVEGELVTPKVYSPHVSRQANSHKGKLLKKDYLLIYLFVYFYMYKITVGRN